MMNPERASGGAQGSPFPVYEDLVKRLVEAHAQDEPARDDVAAHVLATCAGYAYSDTGTVATIMSRMGLEKNACVRVAQTVDAMQIFSTAYLVQSRCGRVVVLCYRGTEPANLGNWLGDADIGTDSIRLGDQEVGVPSGFHRNVRATRWEVIHELERALGGRSLLDPERPVEHPMEALYVTGHSLGGAMAVLFSLSIAGIAEHREICSKLRAVYTFGQPLTTGEPLPPLAREIGRRLFRHVGARDLVPALPPAPWGRFAHFGHEYRYDGREWREAPTPVVQLDKTREIPRAVLAMFATEKQRGSSRYSMAEHGPHHYISALRPSGRITEFGDQS